MGASLIAPDPKCYSFLRVPRAHGPAFGASPGLDGNNCLQLSSPTTLLSPLHSLPDGELFKACMVADSSLNSFENKA